MDLCQECKRPQKTYLNGLCFDCSMRLTGGAPTAPEEEPVLAFAVSEKELDEGVAKSRELKKTGFVKDFPWEGAWTFTEEKLARVLAQVRHLHGQIEEGIALRNFEKIIHAEASVRELMNLLPGGAK